MRQRLAVLCAGQGEQADLDFLPWRPMAGGAARQLWDAAGAQLGGDWGERWQSLSRAERQLNRNAQLAVLVWQGLHWLGWQGRGPDAAADWVVGYSVGELAAHAIAGSLDWADLPGLAVARATAMDGCREPGVAGDCLLLLAERLPPAARSKRLAALHAHGLHLAIQRSAGEAVWGGPPAAVAAFAQLASAAGWGARLLPVTVPSHTPWLTAALPAWRAALAAVAVRAPRLGVLAAITGEPVRTAEAVRQTLAEQLVRPLAWATTLEALLERGVTHALDLGPGHDQTRLLQALAPDLVMLATDHRPAPTA